MTALADSRPSLFPVLDAGLVRTIFTAGVAAIVLWEIWARLVAPLWVGGPLEPAGLVQSVFGFRNVLLAELIHGVVGVIFYPIAYLFIARPLQRRLLPGLPVLLTGIGFGTGLWVFALYVMAHLIAGFPAFLGFNTLTWASLVGHVAYGIVVAGTVRALGR